LKNSSAGTVQNSNYWTARSDCQAVAADSFSVPVFDEVTAPFTGLPLFDRTCMKVFAAEVAEEGSHAELIARPRQMLERLQELVEERGASSGH